MDQQTTQMDQNQQNDSGFIDLFKKCFSFFVKFLIFQSIASFLINQFSARNPVESNDPEINAKSGILVPKWNLKDNTDLNWYVQVNTLPMVAFNKDTNWTWTAQAKYGDWAFDDSKTVMLEIPAQVRVRNASLYAHIFIAPNVSEAGYESQVVYKAARLTRYMEKPRDSQVKRLLDTSQTDSVLDSKPEYGTFVYPNFTVALITGMDRISLSQETPAVLKHLTPYSTAESNYLPPIFVNEFWQLDDRYEMLNESTAFINWTISAYPLSMLKMRLYLQLDEQFRMQQQMMGSSGKELSELKRILLETNIFLLVLGFSVSLLHSLFDFLAFKNDVQFWRQKKDTVGLSLRSIVMNIVFQFVILLYLFDNETSWMILGSSTISLAIECWKLKRVSKIAYNPQATSVWSKIVVTSKCASKQQQETAYYDQQAFRYLSFVLYPCLIAYAAYSLLNQEHKSWYSFIINTLVGFVYAFGFISMTPQLFINYKLKSVAHMPWRTFIYKALNTVVDDIFSFIIKMPLLHRIAAFRDDLVFLVYLYQRYLYPVDKTRANEYGQVDSDSMELENDKLKTKEQENALSRENLTSTVVKSNLHVSSTVLKERSKSSKP